MHRALVVALFLTALIVIPAQRADACSCALLPVDQMMEIHDAAFIGTLVEVGAPLGQGDFGEEAMFTFAVEQWILGDGDSTISVRSSTSGASCGFEIPMGARVGVFLSAAPGGFTGGLCSTMDADVLLAGLVPLTVESNAPAAAVLFGGQGRNRLIVIDIAARVTAILAGDDFEHWVADVSVCPGGEFLFEAGSPDLVVRTVSDLSEVDRIPMDPDSGVTRVWCLAADGTEYIVMANRWTGTDDENLLFDQSGEPLLRGTFRLAEVFDDRALVVFDDGARVASVNLMTGDQHDLYHAKLPSGGFGGVEGLARQGSTVAFISTVYANGPLDSELVVVDLESGDLLAVKTLDFIAGGVTWLGPQTVAVSTSDGMLSPTFRLPGLEKVSSVSWPVWDSAPFENGALAMAAGSLLMADDEGTVTSLRTFPNQNLYNITSVTPDETLAPAPPVVTTTTTTPPGLGAPDDLPPAAGVTPLWPWAVGAAAIAALGGLALRRRSG